jgi:hypothetical protein
MVRIALIAWICLWASTGFAESETDKAIADRQVKILREMAAGGTVDAYFQLGLMAQDDTEFERFTPDEALQFLAIAARAGHDESVRSLAFALLRAGDETLRDEVATLVAISAVLGDTQAVVDLKLMPKFTPITEQQIVDGFNTAIDRVGESQILDCARLEANLCPSWTADLSKLHPRHIFHARALLAEGPYVDMAGIEAVFDETLEKYSAFTGKRQARFREQQERANQELEDQLANERRSGESLSADEFRRLQTDRTVRKFLAVEAKEDFDMHRERVVQALEQINAYRKTEDRVTIEALEARLERGDQ